MAGPHSVPAVEPLKRCRGPHRPTAERPASAGLGPELVLRLLFRLGQTLGLVLNVDGHLLQRRQVLSAVVSAKEQLARVGELDADVCLRAAPIAQIECGQRLCGGDSSGNVAFLVSCLRLLRPAGSGLLLCPVSCLSSGRPSGSAPAGGQLPYSTAQHIPRRQASRSRAVYATSENRPGRVASLCKPARSPVTTPPCG